MNICCKFSKKVVFVFILAFILVLASIVVAFIKFNPNYSNFYKRTGDNDIANKRNLDLFYKYSASLENSNLVNTDAANNPDIEQNNALQKNTNIADTDTNSGNGADNDNTIGSNSDTGLGSTFSKTGNSGDNYGNSNNNELKDNLDNEDQPTTAKKNKPPKINEQTPARIIARSGGGYNGGAGSNAYYNGNHLTNSSGTNTNNNTSSCPSCNYRPTTLTNLMVGLTIPTITSKGANIHNYADWFHNYNLQNFDPTTDSTVKSFIGTTAGFETTCDWVHNGYTSGAIGFCTLFPTVAVVDYGEQFNKLDKISEQYDDTYYFNHLIYLKNLKENTTYYYRYRALDRTGKVTTSSVMSFKTKSFSDFGVIKVPDDLQQKQAPYKLACGQDKKYVLTQDIIAQTQGILLSGHNCNLDLDGHTIIYDEGKPKVISTSWSDYAYNNETTAGIKAELWNYTNYVIRNGIIKQGKNGGSGISGTGFNPIALQHSGGLSDIQGVTLEFYGNSINGVIQTNGKIFSHNVLYDKGWAIDDRHAQIKAVSNFKTCNKQDTVCAEVAYNSLRRFRQSGFAGAEGSNIHHNELYMDSFVTNSFGIGNASNSKSEYNKIFGVGYAPNGLGNGGEGCIVSNNLIYINCYAPERRTDQNGNDEYGRDSAISGIRYTNYGSNPASNQIYENNTIVLKAYNGCSQARGLWISNGTDDMNNIIRNNTIKVEAMPGNLKSGTPPDNYYNNNVNWVLSPITGTGPTDLDIFTDDGSGILTAPIYFSESNRIYNNNIPSPIIFSNNHLIGNVQLITLGEGYGILGNAWFYNTKLERINHDDSFFAPIRLGFWCWNTFGNRMVDNILLGGMTENDLTPRFFGSTGYMDIRYGVSKQISVFDGNGESLKNTELHIKFPDGYFDKVTTDNNGRATIDWLQIKQVKAGSCQDGTCGVSCGEGSGHSGTFQGIPTKIEYSEFTISTADGKLSVTYPKSYLSGSGRIDLK